MEHRAYQFEALSESMLLIRIGNVIAADCNARVHALAAHIEAAALPGLLEMVPAYASLGLRYDLAYWSGQGGSALDAIGRALQLIVRSFNEDQSAAVLAPARLIEIPVCYGGAFGIDLESVAHSCGMSPEAVIECHTQARYSVAMLGFAPGFPYLIGLDPRLHLPRRSDPRQSVPAGSVAIGGAQTGIYPRPLPGGWHLIGTTPLRLFDPEVSPPCLLAPAEQVRFRRISEAEFETAMASSQ